MSSRTYRDQSEHDVAVGAIKSIYADNGVRIWINPNSRKNKSWSGEYIDVIVPVASNNNRAWVIEVETSSSITDQEARDQWSNYDDVYSSWHLAVPTGYMDKTRDLLNKHNLSNYSLIKWKKNKDGSHTFWDLPRLN